MEGRQLKQRSVATIFAIGTANPSNCVYQDDFPDYYFKVTNCQDNTLLKDQLKRICEKSMIKKRYIELDEQTLKDNPSLCSYAAASLDARQDISIAAIPRLAERAAAAAIEEWGLPRSAITHLVFHSSSGADMPGADCRLVESLGLPRSVRRLPLYHLGCFAGATVLRLAKDLAENSPGARVLAVCAEITSVAAFRGPHEQDRSCLVGQVIFGDGAAALIIGCCDDLSAAETPLFGIVSAAQTLLPAASSGAIAGHVREAGLRFHLSPEVPKVIGDNIVACLSEALGAVGIGGGWNGVFWAPHPGGAAILREVEERAGLEEGKLRAARRVLREYGNMSSGTVLFVLDEMRKRSAEEGRSTTGEGLEWGVLFGFGPGVTVETVVLRSVPIASSGHTQLSGVTSSWRGY